jgi:hypothetical protein
MQPWCHQAFLVSLRSHRVCDVEIPGPSSYKVDDDSKGLASGERNPLASERNSNDVDRPQRRAIVKLLQSATVCSSVTRNSSKKPKMPESRALLQSLSTSVKSRLFVRLTLAGVGAALTSVLLVMSSTPVKALPSHEVDKYYCADSTFTGPVVGTHMLGCAGSQLSDGDTSTGYYREEGTSCAPISLTLRTIARYSASAISLRVSQSVGFATRPTSFLQISFHVSPPWWFLLLNVV